ncbi:uncharacterized protein LOC114854764 isoform X2 [Betta splendens]|uniref:Uncharacterized protein LOC114854764 isoform X2 n=1 Tax=Betta splendens TaxID=158456 RepID=A0A6P7MH38_BETSP|nr:uncharacterized protein LOC114854764 isoform X2 [Betta splendens]
MEMWRKQPTLMLFAAALASAQYSVILDQTPRQEYVPLGSSLILRCRLMIPQYQKLRVTFYHYSKNISDKVYNHSSNISITEKIAFEKTYTLSNVTYEDAGWYCCKVTTEIPSYKVVDSSRTQVNITTELPKGEAASVPWWMWIIVGASAFALLLLLVICILLRRRCHKRRDPDPIYINTRPMVNKQPSPRPDNLKAAVSQQLRTPSPGRRYEQSNRKHRR